MGMADSLADIEKPEGLEYSPPREGVKESERERPEADRRAPAAIAEKSKRIYHSYKFVLIFVRRFIMMGTEQTQRIARRNRR
jgi:hypothetical protein